MQLFCTSFALLFSANLAQPNVFLDYSDGTGLAPAPVDNIEGARCSDAYYRNKRLVDVSKALRENETCTEEGFRKHYYFKAIINHDDHWSSVKNKRYMCCLLPEGICRNGNVELVSEKDENGKEWPIAVDCSGSKSCQDPKTHFCPQKGKFDGKVFEVMDVPVCCPIKEQTCYEKSDYVEDEPNEGDCEKNFGRCKSDDHTLLCSKKKRDKTKNSCCRPLDDNLCVGGLYPLAFYEKENVYDPIEEDDEKTWKEACESLATKPEFANVKVYYNKNKCCVLAKLNEAAYYGKDYADLLSDQYERFSSIFCYKHWVNGDKFCGTVTSSYKNEPAKDRAYFEKIHCPHKTKTIYPVFSTENTLICSDSSTCPEDAICIWGKPAAATAAKVKKSFGMCCPKDEYETEMCTAELLGNLLHNKTGLIDPAILSQKKCQDFTQKWGTLDTGAGGTGEDKTGVCCQYKDVPPPPTTTTTEEPATMRAPATPQETEGFTSSTGSSATNNHGLRLHFCPVIFFLSLFR